MNPVQLVHFAPVNMVKRIKSAGIPVPRGSRRLSGVSAEPVPELPKSSLRRQICKKRARVAAIVFEIPADEQVVIDSVLGERNIVSAREAEALSNQFGRETVRLLSSKQHEMKAESWNQLRCDVGMIVIPRSIKPTEISLVIMPPNRKKECLTRLPIEID